MSRDVIFKGEQVFYHDEKNFASDGTAVSNKVLGTWDMEEMHGRMRFFGEVVTAGVGTAASQTITVKIQGSADGGTTWVDRVTGTLTTAATTFAIDEGTFLNWIETDPQYKKAKIILNSDANITGVEIKVGTAYA